MFEICDSNFNVFVAMFNIDVAEFEIFDSESDGCVASAE
jgi:hypothetical protein